METQRHDDEQPFTGPHPTNREFVAQLHAWGFTQRREDGVHLVLRGPHGGTLRVLRSQLGRADTDRVGKAAHLAGITVAQFWAGPQSTIDTTTDAAPAAATAHAPVEAAARRRRSARRDRVTSLVLGVHAEQDRPLGFDQVADLVPGGAATRDQVRSASAQLCREGDLARIRSGVYQWAHGTHATSGAATSHPATATPVAAVAAAPADPPRGNAEALFQQLFPSGVQMTAELWRDFERWAVLTEKLAAHASHAA